MSSKAREALIATLQARFERHPARHPGVAWAEVLARLHADPAALEALHAMESTGGEPDVVVAPAWGEALVFVDCSPQSPAGRRSTCYDEPARESRKADAPHASAVGMAAAMGVELLTEDQYRALQDVGEFDTKTSSWIRTPPQVRALGGALFCDRRYGQVFTYHNGAPSYYAARGFRAQRRL